MTDLEDQKNPPVMTELEQRTATLMEVQKHLDAIHRLFNNGNVTLLVRFPDKSEADLIVSNDDFDPLEAMFYRIKRRVADDKMGVVRMTYEQALKLGHLCLPLSQWHTGMQFESEEYGLLEMVEKPVEVKDGKHVFKAGEFLFKKVENVDTGIPVSDADDLTCEHHPV